MIDHALNLRHIADAYRKELERARENDLRDAANLLDAQAAELRELAAILPGDGSLVERARRLVERVQVRERLEAIRQIGPGARPDFGLSSDERIARIKAYREQTRAGLKEALDALQAHAYDLEAAVSFHRQRL